VSLRETKNEDSDDEDDWMFGASDENTANVKKTANDEPDTKFDSKAETGDESLVLEYVSQSRELFENPLTFSKDPASTLSLKSSSARRRKK
jgi:hypothetical protein